MRIDALDCANIYYQSGLMWIKLGMREIFCEILYYRVCDVILGGWGCVRQLTCLAMFPWLTAKLWYRGFDH